jgi:hypothetical protein
VEIQPRLTNEQKIAAVQSVADKEEAGAFFASMANDNSQDVRMAVVKTLSERADAGEIISQPEFWETAFGARVLVRVAHNRLANHDDAKAFDAVDTLMISGKASLAARKECCTTLWYMEGKDKRSCELLAGLWAKPGTHAAIIEGHFGVKNLEAFVNGGKQMNFLTNWDYTKELAESIAFYPGAVPGTRDVSLKSSGVDMDDDEIESVGHRLKGLGQLLQVNNVLVTLSKAVIMVATANRKAREEVAKAGGVTMVQAEGTRQAIPASEIVDEYFASKDQRKYLDDMVGKLQNAHVEFPPTFKRALILMGAEAEEGRLLLRQSVASAALAEANLAWRQATASGPGSGGGVASPKQIKYIKDMNIAMAKKGITPEPFFEDAVRVILRADPNNPDTQLKSTAANAAITYGQKMVGFSRNRG